MFKLSPKSALGGAAHTYAGCEISELSGVEIVSIASNQSVADFAATVKNALGGAAPKPGNWTKIRGGKLLWSRPSEYFALLDGVDDQLDETLAEKFGAETYLTLQTDAWTCLTISGARTLGVLERFIALDLRNAGVGFCTRSTAQHMSVIILKTGENAFTLITPRSSSCSFFDALIEIAEQMRG